MNESLARKLAEVYDDMGYVALTENTGGNVWVVYVNSDAENAPVIVFGYDTITRYGNEAALEAGEPTSTIYMTGKMTR